MKYQGVIGIGCFGKPQILSRVLRRMVGKYILGNFKELDQNDSQNCVHFETVKLIKALIGGLLENHQLSEPEIIENIKKFFLALERRGFNLSIFTRDGQPINRVNNEYNSHST